MKELHGGLHPGKRPLPPTEVGACLKALNRNGRDKIPHPQHLVGKGFIDERTVGKGQEYAVIVPLTERNNILFPH